MRRIIPILFVGILPTELHSLEVLADFGGEPVGFVQSTLRARESAHRLSEMLQRGQQASVPGYAFEKVSTTSMRPGTLSLVEIPEQLKAISSPLAIAGEDSQSMAWLRANRDFLVARDIPVLLVNVSSFSAYKSLQMAAPGINFVLFDADEFAPEIGISTYPVLINREGVFQ